MISFFTAITLHNINRAGKVESLNISNVFTLLKMLILVCPTSEVLTFSTVSNN